MTTSFTPMEGSSMLDLPMGSVMRSWTGWITPDSRVAYNDIDSAVFYPEDDAFLVDRERPVVHFDVE